MPRSISLTNAQLPIMLDQGGDSVKACVMGFDQTALRCSVSTSGGAHPGSRSRVCEADSAHPDAPRLLDGMPRGGYIRATTDIIWRVLTDAKGFPRWNSTVSGIEGQIREGERLRLHVPGTDRTFTPKVSAVVPNERMTWTGGFAPLFKGVRTFVLTPRNDGSTEFAMEERFSGLMLPLVKDSMPDFGPVFKHYANDLKREAERATS
jgi:hypothetical protein